MRIKFTAKMVSAPGGATRKEQEQHVRHTECSNCGFSDPGGCTFSEVSFSVGSASFQFDLCEWCLTGGTIGGKSEVIFDVK